MKRFIDYIKECDGFATPLNTTGMGDVSNIDGVFSDAIPQEINKNTVKAFRHNKKRVKRIKESLLDNEENIIDNKNVFSAIFKKFIGNKESLFINSFISKIKPFIIDYSDKDKSEVTPDGCYIACSSKRGYLHFYYDFKSNKTCKLFWCLKNTPSYVEYNIYIDNIDDIIYEIKNSNKSNRVYKVKEEYSDAFIDALKQLIDKNNIQESLLEPEADVVNKKLSTVEFIEEMTDIKDSYGPNYAEQALIGYLAICEYIDNWYDTNELKHFIKCGKIECPSLYNDLVKSFKEYGLAAEEPQENYEECFAFDSADDAYKHSTWLESATKESCKLFIKYSKLNLDYDDLLEQIGII